MRYIRAYTLFSSRAYSFLTALVVLGFFSACVSASDHRDWIQIGVTTKNEVIARYGQPDWVIVSPDGDTVIYRKTVSEPSAPRLEIPTAQAAPFEKATTSMQPIDPGLGAKDLNGKAKERLRKEIRIRYDDRGVVQEISSP